MNFTVWKKLRTHSLGHGTPTSIGAEEDRANGADNLEGIMKGTKSFE